MFQNQLEGCAMKRLGFSITSCAIFLAPAVSALAQQSPPPGGPDPGYGYGHMWGSGWGWHLGMIFGPIAMLLFLVGAVAVIVCLARGFSHGGRFGHGICPRCGYGRGRAALDILEERFAKGEIDKSEFEEKRKLLGR
jgi:putative membrane protein